MVPGPSPTDAHNGLPAADSPARRTTQAVSDSPPAALAVWRLHSPEYAASPASMISDSVVSPQPGLLLSHWQHCRRGQAAPEAPEGHLPVDCVSLSAQRGAASAAASDAAAAAAATLGDRFTLQPDAIPEHTVLPPSALPSSLLQTAAASRSQDVAAASLRDSCPASSNAPRLVEGMPLRPVAGSAEWPAGRLGAPRLMLEIPTGDAGRYGDLHLMQTPGAGLGSATPSAAMPGYSGASSAADSDVSDSAASSHTPLMTGRHSCSYPLKEQVDLSKLEEAKQQADMARLPPALPVPQPTMTPCLDYRSGDPFPPRHSGQAPPPRPSADVPMPPPPPRLPPLHKGGSGQLSAGSTPKVGEGTSNTAAPASWWQSVRSSMSFVAGAFTGPSGSRSGSTTEETPKGTVDDAPLSPEDYSNVDAFIGAFEDDIEAASESSSQRPGIDAIVAAVAEGSNGFPPALTAEQQEKLAQAIAANSARNKRAAVLRQRSLLSMSSDCPRLLQQVRGWSGPHTSGLSSTSGRDPQPLDLARETLERIQTLGTDLPQVQKGFLWVGLIMDLISKGALLFQIQRMARHGLWLNVGMILGGLVLSSAMVTVYWLSHYPSSVADVAVGDWRSPDVIKQDGQAKAKKIVHKLKGQPATGSNEKDNATYSKDTKRRVVRWLGVVAAVLQLGSIYAAARAIHTSPHKQRLVAMDLRGLRMADTIFLTLPVALLQTWIGMRCSHPGESRCFAVWGHSGLNVLLLVGIAASLIGATLAFVSLDLNDLRFAPDHKGQPWWERRHLWEIVTFFCYRITELGARIALLGLFAVVRGAGIFAIFGCHTVLVLLAICLWPGRNQSATWWKVVALTDVYVGRGKWRIKLRLPALNDAKLLLAALVWPPSCFVSDATAKTGVFWWRARMGTTGRRPCWSTTLRSALLPFPLYTSVVLMEMGAMYGGIWSAMPGWALRYMQVSLFLSISWLGIGVIWLSVVAIVSDQANSAPPAGYDAVARRDLTTAPKDAGLAKLAGSDGGKLAPVTEQSLDTAAVMSRTSSKAASLGSSGGSSAALSPAAASEAAGEGLIRAVRSLRDVTALHSSIEVQPLTPPMLQQAQQDAHPVAVWDRQDRERQRRQQAEETSRAIERVRLQRVRMADVVGPRHIRQTSVDVAPASPIVAAAAAAAAAGLPAEGARHPIAPQRRSIEITADCRAGPLFGWPSGGVNTPHTNTSGRQDPSLGDSSLTAASGRGLQQPQDSSLIDAAASRALPRDTGMHAKHFE